MTRGFSFLSMLKGSRLTTRAEPATAASIAIMTTIISMLALYYEYWVGGLL